MSINYVPRVTQLDAVQLDEEIVNILKTHLIESSKFLSPGLLTPITPELELILRSLIFKYSMLKNGSTFGQQMLSLKYDQKLLSNGKLSWLYLYSVALKYMRDRLTLSYTTNRTAQSFLSALERFQIIGDFLNLLRFLQSGVNPTLIDYILNLQLKSEKIISTRFADAVWTRELLWHSFIELLGHAAPLVHTEFAKRVLRGTSSIFNSKNKRRPALSTFANTTPQIKASTRCAECGHNPVMPHFMGCDHIFCYYCLQANRLNNPDYKCPRCSFQGVDIKRVICG